MWAQGLALLGIGLGVNAVGLSPLAVGIAGSLLLGLGTAMVYPTLLAAVGDVAHPVWRARALSVYRFWRDLGYAVGAFSAGLIADAFGIRWAILAVGVLTVLSGLTVRQAIKLPGVDWERAWPAFVSRV